MKTQEISPNLTESKLPNKSPFVTHPWLLVVGVGAISMAIAFLAIFSLTNTGRVAKDPTKQTTIVTPKQTTPTKSKSNSSPNWLLIIFLLGAGVGSGVAIYKLRPYLSTIPKRGRSRRQQRRLLRQKGEDMAIADLLPEIPSLLEDQPPEFESIDNTPRITILPPEDRLSNALGSQSLAEMMDIRQHLSLSAILQDLKRPD